MIPIDFEVAFFIYLVLWLLYLGILWARESWRTNINDWSLSEGKLCVCEDCHFAFLIRPGENAARCPRCNNLCHLKKNKNKKVI